MAQSGPLEKRVMKVTGAPHRRDPLTEAARNLPRPPSEVHNISEHLSVICIAQGCDKFWKTRVIATRQGVNCRNQAIA